MENEEYRTDILPLYYSDIMGVGGLTNDCVSYGSVTNVSTPDNH